MDLEAIGLDVQGHEIASVGVVVVRQGQCIDLASARHWLVRPAGRIPKTSAVIHQITDDQAASGARLERVLPRLLRILAGRVLLAHHARVELQFLGVACRRLYGQDLLILVVDTQRLARATLGRSNQSVGGLYLRIGALRRRLNLPRCPAHNALTDALGAAELFLALAARHRRDHRVPLRRLTAP